MLVPIANSMHLASGERLAYVHVSEEEGKAARAQLCKELQRREGGGLYDGGRVTFMFTL
jgi:hypothetical protein